MQRTEKEENMSFEFSEKYSEKLTILEDAIYEAAQNIGNTGKRWLKNATKEEILEKIKLCDFAINTFNECKKFCYGKGKGGTIYFQDMWEMCHNSKSPCFSYIDNIVETKNELTEHLKNN